MPDILHAPNPEQVITSNAWAFLLWLRTTHGIDLPNWAALQHWSASDGVAFAQAIAAFARLPASPLRLARHRGEQETFVHWHLEGERTVLRSDSVGPGLEGFVAPWVKPEDGCDDGINPLPAAIAAPLTRLWPPHMLLRPLADLLLHADLRPDDRLLVVGSPAWPWLAALLEGTTVILSPAGPATLLAIAAEESATVVVAPAQTLAEAAFQRARHRPDLGRLRTIIASGGPLSPEGRKRIYTWIKSDLMLLARTGDTLWGNPLEPVYARPDATPGFFRPPASDPPTP